jgi:hypothetical protein
LYFLLQLLYREKLEGATRFRSCKRTYRSEIYRYFPSWIVRVVLNTNEFLFRNVAMGTSVVNVTPGLSILIGTIAGVISVIGYNFVQPRLQKLTGSVDTCEVHNLHGMPGAFGGLVALAFVAVPLWQVAGIDLTVILAVAAGLAVGFVISKFGTKKRNTMISKNL